MFYYILLFESLILSAIIADPGSAPVDSNSYIHQSQPSHNYYAYRQPESQNQNQIQTPSPYLKKRNPNLDGNIYANPQPSYSSVASAYGNPPIKSSANQCKLHINCPSKKNF